MPGTAGSFPVASFGKIPRQHQDSTVSLTRSFSQERFGATKQVPLCDVGQDGRTWDRIIDLQPEVASQVEVVVGSVVGLHRPLVAQLATESRGAKWSDPHRWTLINRRFDFASWRSSTQNNVALKRDW
jgi:hypothetical protein